MENITNTQTNDFGSDSTAYNPLMDNSHNLFIFLLLGYFPEIEKPLTTQHMFLVANTKAEYRYKQNKYNARKSIT